MKKTLILLAIIILLSACNDRQVAPPIIDGEAAESLTMDSILQDTTAVLDVYSPYIIDTARQILIHEVYLSRGQGIDKSSVYSSKRGEMYYDTHIVNLIFEDPANQKKHLLTKNKVRILSYEKISNKAGEVYILYHIVDRDYNHDQKLDLADIGSLYISSVDGTSFAKITKDREKLQDEKWISSLQRYYFRTVEDSDKNGYFDLKDKKHHYYIEFNNGEYKVIEYDPLDILHEKSQL